MSIRRLVLTLVVVLVCAPLSVSAASKPKPSAWRTFSSRSVGVSFRFPSSWRLSGSSAIAKTVVLTGSGRTFYGLTVLRPGFSPGFSAQATLQRFISYERSVAHTSIYARAHWIFTSVGGQPASAGVIRFPSEGGLATLADAIYVAQAHGRVYEIVMASSHKPPLSRLSQFPSVYGQILRSWRFI